MKSLWSAGDIVASNCPHCRKAVQSRFELRTVRMPRSRLAVRNVLVDVCGLCQNVIGIPSQSIPQLREAGLAK